MNNGELHKARLARLGSRPHLQFHKIKVKQGMNASSIARVQTYKMATWFSSQIKGEHEPEQIDSTSREEIRAREMGKKVSVVWRLNSCLVSVEEEERHFTYPDLDENMQIKKVKRKG